MDAGTNAGTNAGMDATNMDTADDEKKSLDYLNRVVTYPTPDGGILVEAPPAPTEARPVQIVIDASGSMAGAWAQVVALVKSILASLFDGVSVDVWYFDSTTRLVMSTTELCDKDRKMATEALQSHRPYGATNIEGALKRVVDRVCEHPTSLTIFVTDGKATTGEMNNDVLVGMVPPPPHTVEVIMLTANADSQFAEMVQRVNEDNSATFIPSADDIDSMKHEYSERIRKRAPASASVRFVVGGVDVTTRRQVLRLSVAHDPKLPIRLEHNGAVLETTLGDMPKGAMSGQQVDFFARQASVADRLQGLRKQTQEFGDWDKVDAAEAIFTTDADKLLSAPQRLREEFQGLDLGSSRYRSLADASLKTSEAFVAHMAALKQATSRQATSHQPRDGPRDTDFGGVGGAGGAVFRSLSSADVSVPHVVASLPTTVE